MKYSLKEVKYTGSLKWRFAWLFLLFLWGTPSVLSQVSQTKADRVSKEFNKVILLTHLAKTETQDSCLDLSNMYDLRSPMKIYSFSEQSDSLHCKALLNTSDILSGTAGNDHFVLMIHGAGKTMDESVKLAFEMQKMYNVHVLVYNWPAMVGRGYDTKNLKEMKEKMQQGAPQFRELLLFIQYLKNDLAAQGRNTDWSLFLHSMGNYFMEIAADQNLLVGLSPDLFDNLIFNSAAVDSKYHAVWMEKIHIQKRIYVNFNNKDFNLRGLKHLTRAKTQLGAKLKGRLVPGVNYVDFTEAVGFQKPLYTSHSYYIQLVPENSSNIRQYYQDLFNGQKVDLTDSMRFVPEKKRPVYQILF